MTRYIYWCLADIITGLLILVVPHFSRFFRTFKRRNRICLGIYFLCLGVLTIMINIIVILSALSFGVFYIWLNWKGCSLVRVGSPVFYVHTCPLSTKALAKVMKKSDIIYKNMLNFQEIFYC